MASFIILSVPEFNANLLLVGAQTEVITTVSIKAEAPQGEYDYPPVHIITKISSLPPIDYLDHFQNATLTIIDPDGQINQQKEFFDSTGASSSQVHMEKIGTWTIKVSVPAQDFYSNILHDTIHYLACESQTIFLQNESSWANVGSWTSKAPMHQARSSLGAVVANGKIYAIGGCTENGNNSNTVGTDYNAKRWIVNTTAEYDPAANKWTTKTSMPTSRYNLAVVAYQNKIYCIGGITGNYVGNYTNSTAVNEVYDPSTDTWSTKTPMPIAACGQANVLGNKIYIIGGGPNGTLNQVYDPSNDSWSTNAPLPIKSSFQVSVTVANKIYVLSYWQDLDNHVTSHTVIYDPKTDSWSNGQSISSSFFRNRGVYWRGDWWSVGAGATSGVIAPMRIYVFFMQYVYADPLPNIVYDPLNNSLDIAANEPTNHQNFAVVTLNDTLFLIGGYTTYYPAPDDSLFDIIELATNEQYTPLGYGNPDPAYLAPTSIIPPEITVLSPLNQTYKESNVSVVFNTDKAVNWTSYSLDGQQNVTLSGNTNLTDLPNGLHNITVYSEDTFGNIGSSETITFTVAKPEPSMSFPVVPVATVSLAAVTLLAAGLLVYHKKHKRQE